MKQLFYLMLFCASIFTVSCNKEAADITNAVVIQTPKSSANSITLGEAQFSFAKAMQASQSSIAGSTQLNLADFDPQWGNVMSTDFTDTSGNSLAVATTVFQPEGYKKLLFFRQNGDVNFLVLTVRGTHEYLIRKRGQCTMNDFCGYVYFTNREGAVTGGYKLDNGEVIALLGPPRSPRPEVDLDPFEVIATRLPGGFTGYFDLSINASYFGGFNSVLSGIVITGGGGSTSGANNSAANATAPPTFDKDHPICANSFSFKDQDPVNGSIQNIDAGLKNVAFSFDGIYGVPIPVGYTQLAISIQKVINNEVVTASNAADRSAAIFETSRGEIQQQIANGTVNSNRASIQLAFFNRLSENFRSIGNINKMSASWITFIEGVPCQ